MIASITPKFVAIMLLNALGIGAYLGLASHCWIEPELANIPGASGGDAIVWFTSAFPILVLFLAIDSAWFFLAGFAYLKSRQWTLHPAFWLVPLVWVAAVYIDFSHHGI